MSPIRIKVNKHMNFLNKTMPLTLLFLFLLTAFACEKSHESPITGAIAPSLGVIFWLLFVRSRGEEKRLARLLQERTAELDDAQGELKKAAQAAEAAGPAKSALLADMSHDLTFDAAHDRPAISTEGISIKEFEKPNFEGEVLVFEDNAMYQLVIGTDLERVGLKVVMAENGREGLDIISQRLEKPFDLIFMDVHMPVMGGLEAAGRIAEMGVKTPIVALTANIMPKDLALYKKCGMRDALGKPFTSQELWKCLMKYLPVVNMSALDKQSQTADDDEMLRRLRINFVKRNQATYKDIMKAVGEGHIQLAHRLAHTLKSNAGQIGETRLQEAAAETEAMLSEGENRLTEGQSGILETELQAVLENLAPMVAEVDRPNKTEPLDEERIRELFVKLEAMLLTINPECMNLLDDLRAAPGTEELARCVEDFEFEGALEALSKLKAREDFRVNDR